MKKFLFFAAAVTALLSSCQKENGSNNSSPKNVKTITASVSDCTKVVMGEDNGTATKLNWQAGDNLLLINENSKGAPDYSSGMYSANSSGEKATFNFVKGVAISSDDLHYAFYPFEKMDFQGGDKPKFCFNYSDNQTYTRNSFDKDAMPLFAKNMNGTSFTFNAKASVLRLNVKLETEVSDVAVTSVVIQSAENNLSGTSIFVDDEFCEPEENSGNSVTLNCGAGVALSTSATQFCVVLPPNKYEAGDLTITIKTNKGDIVKASKSEATFAAGKVYNIDITANPASGIPIVGTLSLLGPVKDNLVEKGDLTSTRDSWCDTFFAPFEIKIPEGIYAFALYYDAANNVIHSVRLENVIPAQMPCVLITNLQKFSEEDVTLENVQQSWTNALVGILSVTVVQNTYVLAIKNGVEGFYKAKEYELEANKAYMVLPEL